MLLSRFVSQMDKIQAAKAQTDTRTDSMHPSLLVKNTFTKISSINKNCIHGSSCLVPTYFNVPSTNLVAGGCAHTTPVLSLSSFYSWVYVYELSFGFFSLIVSYVSHSVYTYARSVLSIFHLPQSRRRQSSKTAPGQV